jgi:hypothetical protein
MEAFPGIIKIHALDPGGTTGHAEAEMRVEWVDAIEGWGVVLRHFKLYQKPDSVGLLNKYTPHSNILEWPKLPVKGQPTYRGGTHKLHREDLETPEIRHIIVYESFTILASDFDPRGIETIGVIKALAWRYQYTLCSQSPGDRNFVDRRYGGYNEKRVRTAPPKSWYAALEDMGAFGTPDNRRHAGDALRHLIRWASHATEYPITILDYSDIETAHPLTEAEMRLKREYL